MQRQDERNISPPPTPDDHESEALCDHGLSLIIAEDHAQKAVEALGHARREFKWIQERGEARRNGQAAAGNPPDPLERLDHLESDEEEPPYDSGDEPPPPPYRAKAAAAVTSAGGPEREIDELLAEIGLVEKPPAPPAQVPPNYRPLELRLAVAAGEGCYPRDLTARVLEAYSRADTKEELGDELQAFETFGPQAAPRLMGIVEEQRKPRDSDSGELLDELYAAYQGVPGGRPWGEVFGDIEAGDLLSDEGFELLGIFDGLGQPGTTTARAKELETELVEAARDGSRGPLLKALQELYEESLADDEEDCPETDDGGETSEEDGVGLSVMMAGDAWDVAAAALEEPWAPPRLFERLYALRVENPNLFSNEVPSKKEFARKPDGVDLFAELPVDPAEAGEDTTESRLRAAEKARDFADRADALAEECEDAQTEAESAMHLLRKKRDRLEAEDPSPRPLKRAPRGVIIYEDEPLEVPLGRAARAALAKVDPGAHVLGEGCELPWEADAPAESLYGQAEVLQSACEDLAVETYGPGEGRRLAREWRQLDEIYAEQARAGPIIGGALFADLCDELLQDLMSLGCAGFTPDAYAALQAAAEAHLVETFAGANLAAIRAGRTHVRPEDLPNNQDRPSRG